MKNVLILAFALIGLECAAQKQPLFITKGDHNPSEVKAFALGNSSKAIQYKNYLLVKTGETSIEQLFEKVSVERRTLHAGSYQNSCWNVQTSRVEFYTGKDYTGEVTVYINDSRKVILYKNSCGNLLNVREEVIALADEDLPYVEEKVVTKEVVVEKVVVQKEVIVVDNTNYNPRPRVNFSWPRPNYYGGNTNVVNNNIYNNNNNNTYNPPRPTHYPYQSPNNGNPGGADTHTDGNGNAGGTDMNTNTGNTGGPGGADTHTDGNGNAGGTGKFRSTNNSTTANNQSSTQSRQSSNNGYVSNQSYNQSRRPSNNGYTNNQSSTQSRQSSNSGYGNNQRSANYSQQRSSSNGYANNQQQRSSSNRR